MPKSKRIKFFDLPFYEELFYLGEAMECAFNPKMKDFQREWIGEIFKHSKPKTAEEIEKFILSEIGHSATTYKAEGAYTHTERRVILTVCRRSEAIRLRKKVYEIDPSAFMVITKTSEIMGKGFRDNLN